MEQRKKKTTSMSWIPSISLIPIFFFFLPIIAHALKDETSATMRLELIHRHDPRVLRQFHGSGKQSIEELDRFERVRDLAHRDMIRHARRRASETFDMPMHAGRDIGSGVYLVRVKVGTPFQRFWVIADTGSDLTWFRCNYQPQNVTSHRKRKSRSGKRVFSPHRSRTFRTVTCSSQECSDDLAPLNSLKECPNSSAPCLYDFGYFDGSRAMGLFGRDTYTFDLTDGRKGKLNDMVVGCTRSIGEGPTINQNTEGLIGLGLSGESFVNRAAAEYGGKFSYCLVDHLSHKNVSNFLTFGPTIKNATLLGEIQTTPLVINPPYYGVNVQGISVGGQLLRIPEVVWNFNANGGAILDSATTLTFLATPAFDAVIEALTKPLEVLEKMEPASPFQHCYSTRGFNESLMPSMVFHLEGGARLELPVKSYLIDTQAEQKCIGINLVDFPAQSIIGNIFQQNHLWELDLINNTVQFAPSPC